MRLIDADLWVKELSNCFTSPNYHPDLGDAFQCMETEKRNEDIYDLIMQINEQPTAEIQVPLKLQYKNGFAHCKCGCEFESEGYQGEEFCSECGQKVWVGGYNGEIKSNVVNFK